MATRLRSGFAITVGLVAVGTLTMAAQQAAPPQAPPAPTRANILRGEYGRYRANNDVLHYHLNVRIDPDKKLVSGRNSIRFKMLSDDTRLQIDLWSNLNVDKIEMGGTPLKYERELNAVFIDFPETLRKGRTYTIDFHYSGTPTQTGRFGGFTFSKDPQGRHWIFTACEGEGASLWWPNKDQWRDEADSMDISVAIPNDLTDVSNGRFLGKTDLGDGYTRWDWRVHYPINSYNVSVNIGRYETFGERLGDLTLDYFVQPESLEKAKKQFAQARPMIEAFEYWFGEYPFPKDGFKLIEVPYSGMEHQSAVTYGNRFANGYLERDWTGVGVSPKFDFIIIHESAHEWFGNAVSAADVSDMWIQEGWATYLEVLYVERVFGADDALKYINGYKTKVQNRTPIITERGIHRTPPQDMYFKGALMLHTLRGVVNDDRRWARLLKDIYREFRYRNIMTEDFVAFVNRQLGQDLTPFFNQYLRRTALPTLELRFDEAARTVSYRWQADEPGFAMPIRVGQKSAWQAIRPTADWQTMKTTLAKETFEVATDLYYVNVSKTTPAAAPATRPALAGHTQADVEFMQGMIGHHAQALEMTALLYTRTNRPEMKLLAERIDVSQGDEIKMMKTWLTSRQLEVPSEHAHHMGGPLMPGMLTAEQMTKLGAAKGDEFDRLFLEAMIYHHLGAITMVEKLLASPGSVEGSEIFDFASHVDGDQKMEISRMRAMLKTLKGSR